MVLDDSQRRRLDDLFRKHHQEVFQVCLSFAARDREWAMDRVQEVFVKLAQNLGRLTDLDDIGGWLYRVAVNNCLMELRRRRGLFYFLERFQVTSDIHPSSAEHHLRTARDVLALEQALTTLPPLERSVLTLVYLQGKEQTEAAQLLNLSKGYVSKLHKRALALLAAQEWEVSHA